MCSPSAMGSKQANATTWARCRGGNLLRPSRAGVVQQEFLQPALRVAAADAPDGGATTLQPNGNILDTLPGRDGQHNASVLDLEPGQAPAAGDGFQNGVVRSGDRYDGGFAAAHGRPSEVQQGALPAYTCRQFVS